MIALALVIGAQGVPQSLLDASDAANGAYVQCLFATSRAANSARLSVDEFERKLAGSCHAEEEAFLRAGIAIFRHRGEPNGESTATGMAQEARRSVVDAYRTTLQFRP